MPTIYDNIEAKLIDGLRTMLQGARRADFCVGYFNLRGWAGLEESINTLSGDADDYCRLLVGMTQDPDNAVKRLYGSDKSRITNIEVERLKQRMVREFARQLTYGTPTNQTEKALLRLAKQLRNRKLKVKIYARQPLHAKLYLAHRADQIAAIAGFVGSSNLTLSGLSGNAELNVDVVEQDAAKKLARWFKERWDDDWSIDISKVLAAIIENSWAGGPVSPYHIYIKTAWHLSREEVAESAQFRLPPDLAAKLLEHQKQAVYLAAQRLNHQNGVIIGDVVGLGKTLVASAVAKVFQEDHGLNVLVICPPALKENWEYHLYEYQITGKVLSLGSVNRLEDERRYKLVILDESHNLRNRESSRHKQVRDYIAHNSSKVIMLTATPYNKSYEDIASQLLLFMDGGEDLGIIPEAMLKAKYGSNVEFSAKHPNTLISSLSAFEKSEHVDDWRELMRLFMVRRTRAHIKENYAEYDESNKRHYLTFTTGERFYFPKREPRRLNFKIEDNDQYAKLYSDEVVGLIENLRLPRYGLKQYLSETAEKEATTKEKTIIENLSRVGRRLRGFARTGLFKRLESGGESFLLSITRHILRNALLAAACDKGEDLPIGQISPSTLDDTEDDDENQLWHTADVEPTTQWEHYLAIGGALLETIKRDHYGDFKWISSGYFNNNLKHDLQKDAEALLGILTAVPKWDAATDRKLKALQNLCTNTHGDEKILIFTQYKDTVEYLHRNLRTSIDRLDVIHGDTENIKNIIDRFSPRANNAKNILSLHELRVLIATDKLSEGVNLQDAHIVVNYDLPWAIIRLTQRAGRVDRIGQRHDTIYCYSAMPEDGIEKIINLRKRLRQRMTQNDELIGSDERFFEGESEQTARQLYANNISLEDDGEDETDLVSRAHEIWRQAIKQDPALEKTIKAMPDVVYSAKTSKTTGTVAYIRDNRNHHVLAHIDNNGDILSQSQYKILNLMACEAAEEKRPIAEKHHELVAKVAQHCRDADSKLGGQLGGEKSIRRRVYQQLTARLQELRNTPLLESSESDLINRANQLIYNWPLRDNANDKLGRQLNSSIKNEDLTAMVLNFYRAGNLCDAPKNDGEKPEATIVCSMGLV